MSNVHLVRNYTAGGTIAERRFVKAGANDGEVLQAAAATDKIIGVCVQPGGALATERCDVQLSGVADLDYGGTVTRGDPLTSDASGKAVTAAPAAGSNNRLGGLALYSQVSGDIGEVLLAPSMLQG